VSRGLTNARRRAARSAGLNIKSDEELSVTDAAFGRDLRAGAGGEPYVRRSRLTPLGHTVWVSSENRAPERDF
jgi:hypothetical protein